MIWYTIWMSCFNVCMSNWWVSRLKVNKTFLCELLPCSSEDLPSSFTDPNSNQNRTSGCQRQPYKISLSLLEGNIFLCPFFNTYFSEFHLYFPVRELYYFYSTGRTEAMYSEYGLSDKYNLLQNQCFLFKKHWFYFKRLLYLYNIT